MDNGYINAKAYAELINRLEDVKDAIKKQNYGIAMDILYKPYPEFQITIYTEHEESEDERIRKWLVEMVEEIRKANPTNADHNGNCSKAIAWLEKQDEQNLANSAKTCKNEQNHTWSEEDELTIKALINLVDMYYEGCVDKSEKNRLLDWLKSLKDRYTWKPSDEQMKALADALSLAKNCGEEIAFDLRTLQDQLKKLK